MSISKTLNGPLKWHGGKGAFNGKVADWNRHTFDLPNNAASGDPDIGLFPDKERFYEMSYKKLYHKECGGRIQIRMKVKEQRVADAVFDDEDGICQEAGASLDLVPDSDETKWECYCCDNCDEEWAITSFDYEDELHDEWDTMGNEE
jgi:hypothetical protein